MCTSMCMPRCQCGGQKTAFGRFLLPLWIPEVEVRPVQPTLSFSEPTFPGRELFTVVCFYCSVVSSCLGPAFDAQNHINWSR